MTATPAHLPRPPRNGRARRCAAAAAACLAALVAAPDALALPPQAVGAGVGVLAWVALALGSLLALAAFLLPRRVRRAARLTSWLAVGALGFTVGVVLSEEEDAFLEQATPPLQLGYDAVPESMVPAVQAAELAKTRPGAALWLDLRRATTFADRHVAGARNINMMEADLQGFDRSELAWLLTEDGAAPTPDQPRGVQAARLEGALAAAEAIERAHALWLASQATRPPPGEAIVYCNGGFSSAYVTHALRARGVPARRVGSGLAGLESAGAPMATTDGPDTEASTVTRSEAAQEERHVEGRILTVRATREENLRLSAARWEGGAAVPPPRWPAPDATGLALVEMPGAEGVVAARYTATLLRDWGYPRVLFVAVDAETTPLQAAGFRKTVADLLGPAWWVTVAALLGLLLFANARWSMRRGLRLDALVGPSRLAAGSSVGAVLLVEALGVSAHARMMPGIGAATGLGLVATLAWPRAARARGLRRRLTRSWTPGGVPAGTATPEGLRLWHVLAGLAVAVAVGGSVQATGVVALVAAWTEPLAALLWHGLARLRWAWARLRKRDAAATYLRLAGLSAPPLPDGVSALRAAPGAGPLRLELETDDGERRIVAALMGERSAAWRDAADRVVQATAALGRAVEVARGAPGGKGRKATRTRWHAPALTGSRHPLGPWAGLWHAVAWALASGRDAATLATVELDATRFDEAAPEAGTLTVDMLRARLAPRGAEARAARAFGAPAPEETVVSVAGRPFEVLPAPEAAARPGRSARLLAPWAARAFAASAAERWRTDELRDALARVEDLAPPASGKPSFDKRHRRAVAQALEALSTDAARWGAMASRAAAVAAGASDTAGIAGPAGAPSPMATCVRHPHPRASAPRPYELDPAFAGVAGAGDGVSLPLGPASLEGGLRDWGRVQHVAEQAREAARHLLLLQIDTVGRALDGIARHEGLSRDVARTAHLADVLAWLRRGRPLPPAVEEARAALSARFTLAEASAWPASGPAAPPRPLALEGATAGAPWPPQVGPLPLSDVASPGAAWRVTRLTPAALIEASDARPAAVLAATGGPLSHASVLARELDVPVALGLGDELMAWQAGALVTAETLESGRVRLNGAAEDTGPTASSVAWRPLDSGGDGDGGLAPLEVGGKAAGLARARAAGLETPTPLRVATVPTLEGALIQAGGAWPSATQGGVWPAAWALAPPPVARALAAALCEESPGPWALRSSATAEDGGGDGGASFAGVFESVVGARGEAQVAAALTRVWRSAFAPSARSYAARAGVPGPLAMAVLAHPAVARGQLGGVSEGPGADGSWRTEASSRGPADVVDGSGDQAALAPAVDDALAAVLAQVAAHFEGPHQVEWVVESPAGQATGQPVSPSRAMGSRSRIVVLQVRPVKG